MSAVEGSGVKVYLDPISYSSNPLKYVAERKYRKEYETHPYWSELKARAVYATFGSFESIKNVGGFISLAGKKITEGSLSEFAINVVKAVCQTCAIVIPVQPFVGFFIHPDAMLKMQISFGLIADVFAEADQKHKELVEVANKANTPNSRPSAPPPGSPTSVSGEKKSKDTPISNLNSSIKQDIIAVESGSGSAFSLHRAVQIVALYAISTAIRAGLADERIGKIVGGLGMICVGVSTVVSSGIPKSIRSCIWSRTPSPISNEPASKKILRCGVAGAGLVSTIYGICSVYSGIIDIIYPTHDSAMTAPQRCNDPENCSQIEREILKNLPNKPRVLEVPFASFYLKNDTQALKDRSIGVDWGNNAYLEGRHGDILYIWGDDPDCEGVCTTFVKKLSGATVNLENPLPSIEGYEIVENPRKSDIILYYDTNHYSECHLDGKKCPHYDYEPFTHVGLIYKIENATTWVTSKWGSGRCIDHLEEVVPECYGNAVVYLRKKIVKSLQWSW